MSIPLPPLLYSRSGKYSEASVLARDLEIARCVLEAAEKVCKKKMPQPVCNWSDAQIVEALTLTADAIRALEFHHAE